MKSSGGKRVETSRRMDFKKTGIIHVAIKPIEESEKSPEIVKNYGSLRGTMSVDGTPREPVLQRRDPEDTLRG